MTKKALINTNYFVQDEVYGTCNQIDQIVEQGQEFKVHSSLLWVDCPDDINPQYFLRRPNGTFIVKKEIIDHLNRQTYTEPEKRNFYLNYNNNISV
jgi:hypothetical protein